MLGTLEWAHEQARHQALLDLALALRQAWSVRGRREEQLRIYTWAMRAADALGDPTWQRWAAHHLALTQAQMGRIEPARRDYQRALEFARQLGSLRDEMDALHGLAVLDGQTGREGEARQGYVRALELARQLPDPAAELRELHGLTVLDGQTGRQEEARQGHTWALKLARQLSDPAAESTELRNFGFFLCLNDGDLVRGRAMIEQSLAIDERLGDVYNIGMCHAYLGRVDAQAGHRARAIAHYREALRRYEQVQSPEAEEVREALRELGEEA